MATTTTNSAKTYVPIATQTLGSAAASITFSSIPSTYTDLRLIVVASSSVSTNLYLQVNNDTGTNYSFINMYGKNGATGSNSGQNQNQFNGTPFNGLSTTIPEMFMVDVFSYANTNVFKTCLISSVEDNNSATVSTIEQSVQMWRNTAAINTIKLYTSTGTLNSGTTATLYGIKAA